MALSAEQARFLLAVLDEQVLKVGAPNFLQAAVLAQGARDELIQVVQAEPAPPEPSANGEAAPAPVDAG